MPYLRQVLGLPDHLVGVAGAADEAVGDVDDGVHPLLVLLLGLKHTV